MHKQVSCWNTFQNVTTDFKCHTEMKVLVRHLIQNGGKQDVSDRSCDKKPWLNKGDDWEVPWPVGTTGAYVEGEVQKMAPLSVSGCDSISESVTPAHSGCNIWGAVQVSALILHKTPSLLIKDYSFGKICTSSQERGWWASSKCPLFPSLNWQTS